MANPTIYGPGYSTYTRTVRLALEEKKAPYELVEVDFFASEGMPAEQLARQPFGKVPAFEHEGFKLYETSAIGRYVDETFDGPSLQPADAKSRARMTQIISILDAYGYESMIIKIVRQRVLYPMMGNEPDQDLIDAGLPVAETILSQLDEFIGGRDYLVGDSLTLADLHFVPIMSYFKLASDSEPLLQKTPGVRRWYDGMRSRPLVDAYCPEELKSP